MAEFKRKRAVTLENADVVQLVGSMKPDQIVDAIVKLAAKYQSLVNQYNAIWVDRDLLLKEREYARVQKARFEKFEKAEAKKKGP